MLTLPQRLQALDHYDDPELQIKAIGLLGWDVRKEAKNIFSLCRSPVWEPLLHLLRTPFYKEIGSGAIVDWAIEYRMYRFLAPLLRDMVQQQRQIDALTRDGMPFTLDSLFGAGSAQNHTITRTGTRPSIERAMGRSKGVSIKFKVSTFSDFWTAVTTRDMEAPGLEVSSHFLFGSMVGEPFPQPLDPSSSLFLRFPPFTI